MTLQKHILYSSWPIKISELKKLDLNELVLSHDQSRSYDNVEQRCSNHNIHGMTSEDPVYHFKLRQIVSHPYVIYYQWNEDLLHKDIIAIVGPRKASHYAQQVLEQLFWFLQGYDVVTVSWLADGVDLMVHQLSLANSIPTIAVLWWWLQHMLASTKKSHIEKIVQNWWLVLSEFKLWQQPTHYTFPQRNRLVAGLSEMVFLPEAGVKSGSLITVDFARQMQKDVYACPNTIFSKSSQGVHEYMQAGWIRPVINIEMMLDHYFGKRKIESHVLAQSDHHSFLNWKKSPVLESLQKNPEWLSVNALVNQTGLSTQDIMSQLSLAEVGGQVRSEGGVWRRV